MHRFNRREALLRSAAALGALILPGGREVAGSDSVAPYNALGERVGEVGPRSAIVHTRLTAAPERNNRGYSFPVYTHNLDTIGVLSKLRIPDGMTVSDLEGACPGKPGHVRLHYGLDRNLSRAAATEWADAGTATDCAFPFRLSGLAPASTYSYRVEISSLDRKSSRRGATGTFRTAPERDQWAPVRFLALSCQDYACRDHLGGYRTYQSMIRERADFVASIGDNVYYDLDLPFATTLDLARFHWHRMYSQPLLMELFRNTAGYWLKDDHDSHEDDNWVSRPSQRVQPMTYQQLSPVFVEQMPMGPSTYRRFRWGKGLEVFLVENRDFRSPNWDPDGPQKTIWGAEQKAWLKRSLLESDADFKILVSPNCIVGPDPGHGPPFKFPGGGADSHGDGGFGFEGREFRHWVKDNRLTNLITINGDRHWQYHSVDPETGLNEFCCGAVTDSHSVKDKVAIPQYHKFLRALGGYLSIALEGSAASPVLTVHLHDVDGHPVHQARFRRG